MANAQRKEKKGKPFFLESFIQPNQFIRDNRHLFAGPYQAGSTQSRTFLIDLTVGRIQWVRPEQRTGPRLPACLEEAVQRFGPAQHRLVAPLWKGMLRGFRDNALYASSDEPLTYQWQLAWLEDGTGYPFHADLQLAPILAEGAVKGLYGSVYAHQPMAKVLPPVVNPRVQAGARRLFAEEYRLLALRARSFWLEQIRLEKEGLSHREAEVLHLMHAHWRTTRQLARRLQLSPQTIRSHFKSILRKGRAYWAFPFANTRALVDYMEALHLFK